MCLKVVNYLVILTRHDQYRCSNRMLHLDVANEQIASRGCGQWAKPCTCMWSMSRLLHLDVADGEFAKWALDFTFTQSPSIFILRPQAVRQWWQWCQETKCCGKYTGWKFGENSILLSLKGRQPQGGSHYRNATPTNNNDRIASVHGRQSATKCSSTQASLVGSKLILWAGRLQNIYLRKKSKKKKR